ncbi:MAG: fumarylacetoacetate hydrolase family protein [Candidatus Omnitrophota bacterium]|nr:fumarylacetoacetate hydrolase family protein [Candidatus Omnitrophota bacterium]
MKIVRFIHKSKICEGILEGEDIVVPFEKKKIKAKDARLISPVAPSKIILVGLNYEDHAAELGMTRPKTPVLFIKPPTAVIGPGDDIIYPGYSQRVDYEAELAVVIKKTARSIKRDKAGEYILGYTCLNDVTARDIQTDDVQWTRSKSYDTFAPIGPWIETELDPGDIAVEAYLNGEKKQSSRTSELIFDIPHLLEFISGVMTLLPGDVISTGTPPGVGPMVPGDEITVKIEGIGELTNRVRK